MTNTILTALHISFQAHAEARVTLFLILEIGDEEFVLTSTLTDSGDCRGELAGVVSTGKVASCWVLDSDKVPRGRIGIALPST